MITIQQIINTKKGKSAHSLFAYLLNIIVWIYIFHFCKNTGLKSAALKQKALKINSFVKMETVNYPWLLKKDKKGECFALEKMNIMKIIKNTSAHKILVYKNWYFVSLFLLWTLQEFVEHMSYRCIEPLQRSYTRAEERITLPALGWTYGTDRQRRGHPERTNATLESTSESSYGVWASERSVTDPVKIPGIYSHNNRAVE